MVKLSFDADVDISGEVDLGTETFLGFMIAEKGYTIEKIRRNVLTRSQGCKGLHLYLKWQLEDPKYIWRAYFDEI